jgi:formimidoylglutamate deiminase
VSTVRYLVADLTWVGDRFTPGIAVGVDAAGRIAAVVPDGEVAAEVPRERLRGRALLPGMVSAHSHAFQRALRGRGEQFPATLGSFWTWRGEMYALVGRLDGPEVERLSTAAFREMLRAGITCVGEFHYLHHEADRLDWSLDERVLAAARAAGIRIALLETYYRTGAIGEALQGAQRRFESIGPAAFWQQWERLDQELDTGTQSLGVAVHSLRAASLEDLREIHAESRRRQLQLHIHVEEQRREIDEANAVYGHSPIELLLETLRGAEGVAAIHCTHTKPRDLARFLGAGGNVVLCPLTEANLGDGLPELPSAPGHDGRLSLGTDSNTRISMLEEMRWLEYGQRLRRESRGVLRNPGGDTAAYLLDTATAGGGRALGLPVGAILPGYWADFAVVDLGAPALAESEPDTLAAALVFGAGDDAIAGTYVGGIWRASNDD